ncbi:MAG: hypothetical protein D6687_09355 [Acidobacteria bacterium]|nr:MAG: hypothetical protein D6687_09355 [Acidobacteriota bacterium]BCW95092.1 MAG: hypothetical protein KatS3mg018_0574 [Fimbriimonadales bacterium]
MRKTNDLLDRLLALIEQGVKTPGSALLYASEYDRLHNTNLAEQLQNLLAQANSPSPFTERGQGGEGKFAGEEQKARAKPRKRKVVPDASLDNPTD